MAENVKIQRQTPAGFWQNVGMCLNDPNVIAKRLDEAKLKYKTPVRAVDQMNRMLDMR